MKYSIKLKSRIKLSLIFIGFTINSFGQTYTTGVVNLSNTSGLVMTAKIDVGSQVTLTLTGPSGRWFAVGFNANSMTNGTDVVGVHSSGTLSAFDCNLTGFNAPVTDPQQNWTITSDAVNAGVRTVIATRALNTGDANDYVFPATPTSISLIWARSSTASFSYSYHGNSNRGVILANFALIPPPAAPTGASTQTVCSGATLAQLTASGTAIQWYATPNGGSPLATNTVLVNGSIYYASQTVNSLESANRLAVTVTLNTIPVSPSAINGALDFCYSGTSQQYSISGVSGATSYVWTTPIGSTGSSTGTTLNLLFTPGFQTGNLSVKSVNSCGQSGNTTISINQHLPSAQTLNVSTCSPYIFNGQTLTQSGTYSYQGATVWGCDSTIVLNLDYSTSFNQTISEEACGSFGWNGQTYFSSGTYLDTLQTINGCDSIVTLDLAIYPIESITLDSTVFGSFTWNGVVYNNPGTFTQYFTSLQGCDSTVTINLIIEDAGLDEEFKQLYLYPNPVGTEKMLYIPEITSPINYVIMNIQGEVVQTGSASGTIKLDESLNSGIYFLQFGSQVVKVLLE
jgi:hypothetical protein